MQFARKKKRGQSQKTRKTWYSEDYRITWRKEVFSVTVPARYEACVRIVIPNFSGLAGEFCEMWDFVNAGRHLHKTMKAAQEACEHHKRLWSKACEVSGIRGLTELFGRMPLGFPCWVKRKMNPKTLSILIRPRNVKYVEEKEEEPCPETASPSGDDTSPCSPTSPSPTSDPDTSSTEVKPGSRKTRKRGPASPASDGEKSTTRTTRRAGLKATSIGRPSAAPPAKAADKAPGERAKKCIVKQSASGRKKPKNTPASSKSAKKPSKGLRAKKSKPSVS